MRIIYIFRLAFACLLLWPTVGLADEHEDGGHHDAKACDTTPVKLTVHDTVLWSDLAVRIDPTNGKDIPGYSIVWEALFPLEYYHPLVTDGNTCTLKEPGLYAYKVVPQRINNDCPNREGDTILALCDTLPFKFTIRDTMIATDDTIAVYHKRSVGIFPFHNLCWKDLSDREKEIDSLCLEFEKGSFGIEDGVLVSGKEPCILCSQFTSHITNCPDRIGDTVYINATRPCDTTPVKHSFQDTTLYYGDSCWLMTPEFKNYRTEWHTFAPAHFMMNHDILIWCSGIVNSNQLIETLFDTYSQTIPIGHTDTVFYAIRADNPDCPDREGDTIYITFDIFCDTVPVKFPFHDTVFCEGDSLLLVATDRPHAGYSTLWSNLSSMTEVIYEGDSFYVTEPGTYAFQLYNMVNNGCPDIEGDTVNVAYVPKPQAFLPKILVPTCGGREGALMLESNQPYIDFHWSDGDSTSSYRFAYRGDTIDKRFCLLTNVCGDTVLDSVSVYFQPPYAYLGGDSLMGCRGDSVLFDMGAYNRHLPHYDSLRFIWTLRGDTLLDGLPGAAEDPTRLWVRFPQDSGLLTVQIFQPDSTETDNDGNPIAVKCPVATDSLKLQFYIWPDIDFFVRNGDTTICHYDSIEMFLDRDSLVFSPDAYYIWLFDSVPYDTTADKILYAADTGVYTVTGVNYCSRHSESFVLHHHPKARITVELQDTTVCPETPVSLDPTLPYGGNRYVWFKGNADGDDEGNYDDDDSGDDGGNYMEFRNPGEAPEDGDFDTWPWEASAALWVDTPGAYTLYVMDSVGCMAHSVLNVTEEDCTPQFEAPNVFTPNGDGINDVFKLKTMEKLFDFEIRLFNRWGNQVYAYKGEPEEFSWDGTLYGNGQGAPDGVYFYVATFKDYKGKKKKQSGSVTILR